MCKCISDVNGHLKERNTRLATSFCISRDLGRMDALPIIQSEKIDSKIRGKAMTVVPTFCPFCGTKYPRADDVPEQRVTASPDLAHSE